MPAHHAPLTPREEHLATAASRLMVGVGAHGVLAVLLALAGIGAGLTGGGLLSALQGIIFRFNGTPDAAWVAALLLTGVCTIGLAVVRLGVQAHERWTWLATVLVVGLSVAALMIFGFFPALLTLAALGWGIAPLLKEPGALQPNPVAVKELRERMRGGRAYAVMTVYLILMSAVAVILFLANAPFTRGLSTSVTGDLGRTTFAGLVALELAMLMFIAPSFTAGSVTGERERQTYDLLKITLLPRATFLIGKLESALGFIALLLLAAIPLQSIAFLFGGVSEVELVLSLLVVLVTALTFGAVGVFFSTLTEKTTTASVRSYSSALLVMLGAPLLGAVVGAPFYAVISGAGTGMTGSPVWEGFLVYLGALVNALSPFTAASASQTLLLSQGQAGLWSATLSSNGAVIPLAAPWMTFCLLYLSVSAVLVTVAVRRIRAQEE
ncbi:MAG: hypothetical protein MUF38_03555 [Anaerolineae bacterium]|nr:hypothetical protein [Anaerolineae bacterium]